MDSALLKAFSGYADATRESTTDNKIQLLEQKRQEKLTNLGANKNYEDLDNSYTTLDTTGTVESNKNKIWNDSTAGEMQYALGSAVNEEIHRRADGSKFQLDAEGNEVSFDGDTRRLYMYGTKDSPDAVKIGLARGDLPSSDYRYEPGRAEAEGFDAGKNGYGWDAGESGVDLNKKLLDVELPYNTATALEGMAHGRTDALANRKYPDYLSPEALTHASGVSEYYSSAEGLLGDSTNEVLPDASVLDAYKGLPGVQSQFTDKKQLMLDAVRGEVDTQGLPEKMLRAGATGALNVGNKIAGLVGEGLQTAGELQVNKDTRGNFYAESEPLIDVDGAMDKFGAWLKDAGTQIQKDTVKFTKENKGAKLTGFDTKDVDGLLSEIDSTIETEGYLSAFGKAITDSRSLQLLAQSVPEMIALAASTGGMALVNVNNNINIAEDSIGRELTAAEKAKSAAVSIASTYLDRAGDKLALSGMNPAKLGIKTVVDKAPTAVKEALASKFGAGILKISEAPLRLAGAAGVEGVTEYGQTLGEEAAQNPAVFDSGFTDEQWREAGVAGVVGAAMGGHMATPKVAKDVLGGTGAVVQETAGLVKDKFQSTSASKTEDKLEVDPEEVLNRADEVFGKFAPEEGTERPASKDLLSDIRGLEADVYAMDEKHPDRGPLLEAIKNTKIDLAKEIEALEDTTEYSRTLGSKAQFMDLVDDVMEANDNVIGGKLEDNLRKIAESFGIVDEDFKKIKKDYETVNIEATKSSKGYMTQGKALRSILGATDPDTSKAQKLIKRMQGFESSQKKWLDVYDSAKREMETKVNDYNKALADSKTLPEPKGQKFKVSKGSEFTLQVQKLEDGSYKVSEALEPTAEAKRQNIIGIRNELSKSAELISKAGVKQADTGIQTEVMVDTEGVNPKIRPAVDSTVKYFQSKGVNAFIGDEGKQGSRNSYIVKDNKQVTNKAMYSDSDVVGVLMPNVTNQKEFDEFAKDIRNPKSGIRRELQAAIDAKATIVMEQLGKKQRFKVTDEKGKVTNKSVAKMIEDNIVGFGRGYQSSGNREGRGKGAEFRPAEVAKTEREARKLKASKVKVIAADKKAALDKKFKQFVEFGDTTLEGVESYFKESDKLKSYLENRLDKDVDSYKEISKEVKAKEGSIDRLNTRIKEATTASEESELRDRITKIGKELVKAKEQLKGLEAVSEIAEEQIEETETKVTKGKDLLAKYKEALESDKITGDSTAEELMMDLDQDVIERVLKDSVSKGAKKMYTKYVDGKVKLAKATDEGAIEHILDINEMVKQSSTKPTIALVDVDNLFESVVTENGKEISSKEYIAEAKAFLSKVLTKSDIDEMKTGGHTKLEFTLKDSPAYGLLFTEEGINDTVVLAMKLAIDEYVAYNTRMLSATYKSKEDVAQMLGIMEEILGKNQYTLLKDKGVFKKTMDNEIGKAVMTKLGLVKKAGIEDESYMKLVAELGQIAGMVGVHEGLLEETSVTVREYQEAMTKDDPSNKTAFVDKEKGEGEVRFLREKLVKGKRQDEALTEMVETYEAVHEMIADEATFRKEPSRRPIAKSRRRNVKEQVAKDVTGNKIPKGKKGFVSPDEAINNLVDTEWKFDRKLIEKVKGMDQNVLKKWLGFKTEKEMEKMAFEAKAAQVSVNRDIEKSIDELTKLVEDKADDSLYFDWFYSSNGRYMLDSNTINPQTDKQLHRWLITPAKHTMNYVVKKGRFLVDGEDLTDMVRYAVAQSFGFAVDKQSTADINAFADKMLAMTNEQIDELENEVFVEGKAFELDGMEIEPEHVGHMLQGIEFLRQAKTGKFSSNLSAEFDAVTSGFGLKLLQMPILRDMWKWLNKVGIFQPKQLGNYTSMNDVLTSKGFYGGDANFYDSYQSLAVDAKIDKSTISSNESIYKGKVSVDKVYGMIESVLPKLDADGSVSKTLRTLFKDPFMTFNYSAGIRSIRGSLSNTMMTDIIDGIVAGKDGYTEVGKKLAKYAELDLEVMIDKLRTEPIDRIKVGDSNLEMVLLKTLDSSYGAKVEEIMTNNFGEFMKAHKQINGAFKAMFEVFNVRYKQEIAKVPTGELTIEKKLEIIDKLREQFPVIKGPLSSGIDDGVAIYSRSSVTPNVDEQRQSPAQTYIMTKEGKVTTSKARYMLKEFEAAISAGSVVPIHYVDGALMAQLLGKGSAITAIHDAIIPPLSEAKDAIKKYNESMIKIAREFSLVEEINTMLNRVELTEDDLKELNTAKVSVMVEGEDGKSKAIKLGVGTNMTRVRKEFAELASKVKDARDELFSTMDAEGVTVGHMAAVPGSMWSSKAKAETKQEEGRMSALDKIQQGIGALFPVSEEVERELDTMTDEQIQVIVDNINNCK